MSRMISVCGLVCSECPAYIATKADDYEALVKVAELWSKEYHADLTPEGCRCDGCQDLPGRHIGHWSECKIQRCGHGRSLVTCASCQDYACEKLTGFFGMVPAAKTNLDALR